MLILINKKNDNTPKEGDKWTRG